MAAAARSKRSAAPRVRYTPAELRAYVNAAWEKTNSFIVSEHWRLKAAHSKGGKTRPRPKRAPKPFITAEHPLEAKALERMRFHKKRGRKALAAEQKTAEDLGIKHSKLMKKVVLPGRRARNADGRRRFPTFPKL